MTVPRPATITLQAPDPRGEQGAYTIQFLISLLLVLGCAFAILQIAMVFVNAILVQHALGLAAQEASARGGYDDTVERVFTRHVPSYLSTGGDGFGASSNCAPNCLAQGPDASPRIAGVVRNGREPTSGGELITLVYRYEQDFPLLRMLGIDAGIDVTRKMTVGSQSAK